MKRCFIFCMVLVWAAILMETQVLAYPKELSIATVNNRPLSIDRLLYTAFNDLEYYVSITSVASLQQSYAMANAGERNGVISPTPNMLALYPNLVQVPVALEYTNIVALTRKDSALAIDTWEDLSGMQVGILTEQVYMHNQIAERAAITVKETNKQLLEGLVRQEYDAVVLSLGTHETFHLPETIEQSGILESFPEYLYLNEEYESLVPAITQSLEQVFADGRGEKILLDEPIDGADQKKTVLHIFSTNMQIQREEQFTSTLRNAFENDMSLEWYNIELNARRFSRDENRMGYFANLLRQDCVRKNVAAIVVSGDDAIAFLTDYYYLFFRNVPVVFYSVVDAEEVDSGDFRPYFTGIVDVLPFYETLDEGLSLFPETKNVYVVNDYTSEGRLYREAAQAQLEPFSDRLNIRYNEDLPCDALLAEIKALPADSLLLVGSYFSDANGQYYPLNEFRRLLERDCEVPIFSFHSTRLEYNALGGKCLDYQEHALLVADRLVRILAGESVGDIPIVSDAESYSRWVFDHNRLEHFQIAEKSLPAGAQILNKPLRIWESDPRFVITLTGLLLLGAAAAYLLIRYYRTRELLARDATIQTVKERLERIINSAPLAFMLTVNGRVVEANEFIRKHMGVQVGDEVIKFYAEPPQRKEALQKAFDQFLLENHVISYHMKNGEAHRFLSNLGVIEYEGKPGFMLWGMDIEESEKQRDEMHKLRQNLQMVLDLLPIPIRILDMQNSTISYINNAAARLFELASPDLVVGVEAERFMPKTQPDGSESVNSLFPLNVFYEPVSVEKVLKKMTGELFDARVISCLMDYNGVTSSLGIIEDLTAEKEYRRMMRDTAEKERESHQLKSRFLVNMSHEIRTPMNAIIGLTDIELHKNPPPEIREIYKKINTSAKNLLGIINDILDLSKIEADKIELFEDEFELEEVLNSALLVASPRLEGKNVEFLLNVSLELPRFVVGDRTRLWQILKNFLDNSAKFTENGKIMLTAVPNAACSDAENLCITFIVADTGIGMDENQIQKLFEPYEQIHNEAQKRYSGTGLGMAISKQLCEIMGGDLQVVSRLGEGTTITANIPFKRSGNLDTGLDVLEEADLAGVNVLAVDDDSLALEIMSNIVRRCGANFVSAASGEEALAIILQHREQQKFFDVILLDYLMETQNGLETARNIQLALSEAPKVLMVTAYHKLFLKNELAQNGISDIIEKPFIPSLFIRKLRSVLGREAKDDELVKAVTQFANAKVLLCEDYPLNQEVALGMLEQFGVEAEIAENGKQAVEYLNSGHSYDLIFMDLQMPVMDGYEATRIIRSNHRFDSIPLITLTADAMKEIVDKCLAIGMNDHIAKPIEFDTLHRILLKWLPADKRVGNVPKPTIPSANEALARFGGNPALYERALKEFGRLLPDEWPDFEHAAAHSDETGSLVHKIKGAAGNFSEQAIYQTASDFERSLRAGKPEESLYRLFVKACGDTKARIAQLAGEPEAEKAKKEAEAGTETVFARYTAQLKAALSNYEMEATLDILKRLQAKEWPFVDPEKLQQVYEQINAYEFDIALTLLEHLCG